MRFLDFIARHMAEHRGWLGVIAIIIASGLVALTLLWDTATSPLKPVFLIDGLVWEAAIVAWLYVSCWFRDSLMEPTRMWSQSAQYQHVLARYCLRCGISGRSGHSRDGQGRPRDLVAFKGCFYLVWFVYAAFTLSVCPHLALPCLHAAVVTALALIVTLLNAPSYFLCFSLVWLLKDLSREGVALRVGYLRDWPERTPQLVRLSKIVRQSAMLFLTVSLLCSVGVLLHTFLLAPGDYSVEMVIVVIMAIVGIVSCCVFVLLSHVFLNEIVSLWEQRSLERHIRKHGSQCVGRRVGSKVAQAPDLEHAVVWHREGATSGDLASMLLALLSLSVDVLALYASLGII